ncbi:Copia protein, partial [Acromyrmex echinatior]
MNSGISRRLAVPYHPEQNGLTERKNCTLLDTIHYLLIEAVLSPRFWVEAINTANYRCPTASLDGKTLYEAWHGRPNLTYLREFGCKTFYLNMSVGKSKLDARFKEGVLVGYSKSSKAYRVWI